jgi:hypothetical protein
LKVTTKPGEPRDPLNVNVAALQNLTDTWHKILDKLGLNVVVVQFDARLGSPIYAHPGIWESLGLELREIGAGFFDSMMFPTPGSMWCFYHCHDLGKAIERLKSQIEARHLLGITNILHAEESNQLRVWYSWDPDAIGKLIEPSK